MIRADPPILLIGRDGEPCGRLRAGAMTLAAEAEGHAERDNVAVSTAISATLTSHVEAAGFHVTSESLQQARQLIHRLRRGEKIESITVAVGNYGAGSLSNDHPRILLNGAHESPKQEKAPMRTDPPNVATAINCFEAERTFPDPAAQAWYDRLIGLNDHKERLLIELEMLLFPEQVEAWSKKYHGGRLLRLWELFKNRVPLVLFEGDVGTGKTALAETVGDALARRIGHGKKVHLLKLNTQVRGTGLVGEMSDLIAQAFAQVEARAKSLKGDPVLFLIDEADSLAGSRDATQMHHEDKAGLNTVLQRLDNLRLTRLPIATLFITNRPEALDPAVRRRAVLDLHFERPNDAIRAEIIKSSVPELSIGTDQMAFLIRLTSSQEPKNRKVCFTASDLTDRLLPGALRAAYTQKRALSVDDLVEQAKIVEATPKFGGN
jgi:AAA+ superfamily predicted ATPase